MESPVHMHYFQMLLLLLLMGVCTIWVARLVQWLVLRKTIRRKKIFFILLISIAVSYLIASVCWYFWPQNADFMWGIFFLPTVISELIILIFTFIFFKRNRNR